MPKISSTDNRALIVRFLIKVLVATAVTLLLFNGLTALILLKTDLSLDYVRYIELFICALSSFIISYLSLTGFNQSYMLISLLSIIPISLYSLVNMLVNKTEIKLFIIKIILYVIFCVISAVIKSFRKRRK